MIYETDKDLAILLEEEEPQLNEYFHDRTSDYTIRQCAMEIKNLKATCEAIQEDIKRQQNRIKSYTKQMEWLKDCAGSHLNPSEKYRINELGISLYWLKTESVKVDDVDSLPEDFKKVTVTADKRAIKEAIKSNGVIPEGASLEQSTSLVVR